MNNMIVELVEFVGGPANGEMIIRPKVSTVLIPIGTTGACAVYTLRQCRSEDGRTVHVLAPAGRPVEAAWLAKKRLSN